MLSGVKVTDLDLPFVKDYLRVDFTEDDTLISTLILAAQSFIQSYLNQKFTDFVPVPDEFTIAALAIIAHWYEKRGIQGDKNTTSELAYIFSGLLDQYRKTLSETIPDTTV